MQLIFMSNEIPIEEPEDTEVVAQAMGQGMDLLEIFLTEFKSGVLGEDKDKAKARFLHRHGLNSSPDVLDD